MAVIWQIAGMILLSIFASSIPALVGRILLALGIGYVTYTGATYATDQLVMVMKNSFGSIGGEIGGLLGFLYIDKALSMIVSAFAAGLAVNSAANAVTKMVIKK
ncbi:DUF2523 domain-containing protein [Undibacterium sp. FT79W]|uniref:DUF2523 family protein n=1 Tax=Undibacterium sp. FT79W TaxID=2762296 RepID=UPI00164BCFAC|nr:DUF2523 family protein [Undibacterium sp. FT79W]MBC3878781.1 DUF2523 domain-containing protein [Undibacterium sp. FT79W]